MVSLAFEPRGPASEPAPQPAHGLDVGPAMRSGMEPGAITATHAAVRIEPAP